MLFNKIRDEAAQIGRANGTKVSFRQVVGDKPALSDTRMRQLTDAAKQLNLTTKPLPSGATHDAQSMVRFAPCGMIFILSVGGISHAPAEFSKPADIVNRANVLFRTVIELDAQKW
jgi:acetylornithine deacetylase/succinyl-diaminopimelate desuccinylase-like protein